MVVHSTAQVSYTFVSSIRCVQILAVKGFNLPTDGTVAIYVDNRLIARIDALPVAASLPVFPTGTHSIVASLQDKRQEVLAESEVEVECSNTSLSLLPLWNFDGGVPELATREAMYRPVIGDSNLGGKINAAEPLTLIWTCPEWEQDWVAELLAGGGVQYNMITVRDLGAQAPLARNALIAVSQNDERSRPPHLLASYLLGFRARGFRVCHRIARTLHSSILHFCFPHALPIHASSPHRPHTSSPCYGCHCLRLCSSRHFFLSLFTHVCEGRSTSSERRGLHGANIFLPLGALCRP